MIDRFVWNCVKKTFGFFVVNWLVLAALSASAIGFFAAGVFGAVAGVPLFLLDWSLKLGAILRELRKKVMKND